MRRRVTAKTFMIWEILHSPTVKCIRKTTKEFPKGFSTFIYYRNIIISYRGSRFNILKRQEDFLWRYCLVNIFLTMRVIQMPASHDKDYKKKFLKKILQAFNEKKMKRKKKFLIPAFFKFQR
jgi:hypothetical protein